MIKRLPRRWVLAGFAAGLSGRAIAGAPGNSPRPSPRGIPRQPAKPAAIGEAVVGKANLKGAVSFVVADAETGEVLDLRSPDRPMPPASTLKAVTALYALERLGGDFQFETKVMASAPIVNGRVDGDIALVGGGDPVLDTDRLADVAISLREAGLREVSGRFLVYPDALPTGEKIDADQPEHVAYNPAFGGLNLNFNRVHFEWVPKSGEYELTMQARARRFRPSTEISSMSIVDREAPVYEYRRGLSRDTWSVARRALGKKKGARWLPVRFPAMYTADVFRTLMRSNGIVLKRAERAEFEFPRETLAVTQSPPMRDVIAGMMRHSTNLTAEMAGLQASIVNGVDAADLVASGSRMAGWAETRFGVRDLKFRDHSGLGYASEISALAMVDILRQNPSVAEFMKTVNIPSEGNSSATKGAKAVAKTGTLNFVSSLAGFLSTAGGRKLAFAIFTADTERRDAIPPEARERPPGSRSWARRSRTLQKSLLRVWAENLDYV